MNLGWAILGVVEMVTVCGLGLLACWAWKMARIPGPRPGPPRPAPPFRAPRTWPPPPRRRSGNEPTQHTST